VATKPYISRLEDKVRVLTDVYHTSQTLREARRRVANTAYPADAARALAPAQTAWENALYNAEIMLKEE
jgi:hypothetical protein